MCIQWAQKVNVTKLLDKSFTFFSFPRQFTRRSTTGCRNILSQISRLVSYLSPTIISSQIRGLVSYLSLTIIYITLSHSSIFISNHFTFFHFYFLSDQQVFFTSNHLTFNFSHFHFISRQQVFSFSFTSHLFTFTFVLFYFFPFHFLWFSPSSNHFTFSQPSWCHSSLSPPIISQGFWH